MIVNQNNPELVHEISLFRAGAPHHVHWGPARRHAPPPCLSRGISVKTPVLLLCFNRPDTTRRVLEQIALAQPPQLFVACDGARPDRPGEQALVAKARRRGHWGWNVGKAIEVSPHVRAASPAALYWTGEGRKIPKIRFRRGTVVHRKKFTAVPTGFLEEKGDGG